MAEQRPIHAEAGMDFNDVLLVGVILLMLAGLGIGVGLYLVSSGRIESPELQPSVRVARESDFPVLASRIVNWGERTILVVRRSEDSYSALQGTATGDGCLLRWDPESLRVVSPCSHLVYDLHGNVVTGLTTTPLRRYVVFVRGGTVFVTG